MKLLDSITYDIGRWCINRIINKYPHFAIPLKSEFSDFISKRFTDEDIKEMELRYKTLKELENAELYSDITSKCNCNCKDGNCK